MRYALLLVMLFGMWVAVGCTSRSGAPLTEEKDKIVPVVAQQQTPTAQPQDAKLPSASPASGERKKESYRRQVGGEKTAYDQTVATGSAPSPSNVPRHAGIAAGDGGCVRTGPVGDEPDLVDDDAYNREGYTNITDNPFLKTANNPLSTFSIDVDTASYANVRRFLNSNSLPPPDAVRIEELVNYFAYDYPSPKPGDPFAIDTEVVQCPWSDTHRLVRVGLHTKEVEASEAPPANLVFLLDVSGSMADANKLPLVKEGLRLLVDSLRPQDKVAIVVYAGSSGLVLEPTNDKSKISDALDRLESGGSTNGGEGIQLAYKTAEAAFVKGGTNRVILCTDGDFNVGVTSHGDLVRLIEEKREGGVFLSVLGFGSGNVQDSTMESLADKGNGNYAYIDGVAEARKVLAQQAGATLITVAKDVKLQVEFNPKHVSTYRLIGYENRVLRSEDFNDDQKDAGEIGAGHSVTALYEVVPTEDAAHGGSVDPLKYQKTPSLTTEADTDELLTVKIRYKAPDGKQSKLLSHVVQDASQTISQASANTRFAAAVAAFGMLLRNSEHRGHASFSMIRALAKSAAGTDSQGWRTEFLTLVDKAEKLKGQAVGLQ